MAESIGEFFPTQVPSYVDPADIRKAFNLYHYGTENVPTNENQILSASVAGYIRDTLAAIDAIVEGQSVITVLLPINNLNDITTTGVYHTPSTIPVNHPSLNYPAGRQALLIVNKSGDYVYQTFMTNEPTTTRFYFRVGSYSSGTSTWTFLAWQELANAVHGHDDTYYTKAQIDNRLGTSLSGLKIAVTDANGKIVANAAAASLLDYLAGTTPVTSSIQGQLNDRALLTHYHDDRYYLKSSVTNPQSGGEKTVRVFVQSTQPTGAAVGDLWIY